MSTIQISGLKKDYAQGDLTVHALNGVDLEIGPGEFTALMGPSGSGKTTLLNIIGGLDVANAGDVEVDGKNVAKMSPGDRSEMRLQNLGFVFQAYNLIPVLSAEENAEFVLLLQGVGAAERKKKVRAVLDQVGLEGLYNRRPHELSGGQQQRVAVARAIVSEPAVILADEPTANLDSKTAEDLIETMKRLNEELGITFVFATHDPLVMEHAKRVVKMKDGMVEEDIVK
jgi:putative ABC transport system ATP-binding protein